MKRVGCAGRHIARERGAFGFGGAIQQISVAPLRLCSTAGCTSLTSSGKCPKCSQASSQQRGKTVERGYDGDHKRLRVDCFERDGWKCRDCGWEPEIVADYRFVGLGMAPTDRVLEQLARNFNRGEKHLHADHILRIEDRPDLRLDLNNLQTLCNECHSRKTRREQVA